MIRQVFLKTVMFNTLNLSTLLSIQKPIPTIRIIKPGLWPLNLMPVRDCDEVWVCETNSWIRYDMQKWEKPTEMEDVHAEYSRLIDLCLPL